MKCPVDARNISLECQRLWQTEGSNLKLIPFNLTWIFPPYLHSSNVINNLVVDLKLMNIMENNTIILIDTADDIILPQVYYNTNVTVNDLLQLYNICL